MNGNQIVFKDLASAIYIGESWIKRTHSNLTTNPFPLKKCTFEIDIDFEHWVDLETYITITLSDEDWTEKIFEIFEITRDNKNRKIRLTVYEVNI